MYNERILNPAISFIPSQPELESCAISYSEQLYLYSQPASTSPLPLLYYQLKTPKQPYMSPITIIPSGHVDIIIACNDIHQGEPLLLGSVQTSHDLKLHPDTTYFGVRLLPMLLQCSSGATIQSFGNTRLSLDQLFPVSPDQLSKLGSLCFSDQITHFHLLLSSFLYESSIFKTNSITLIYQSLELIYASRGTISVQALANQLNCSTRHLRNLYDRHIGISPKRFSQIIRYQHSIRHLLQAKNSTAVLDLIAEHGYYDQSHFINEFKKFNKYSPNQWVQQVSH